MMTAGLTFEMYVQEDLTDIQLEILSGEIELSLENGSVYQLKHANTVQVWPPQVYDNHLGLYRYHKQMSIGQRSFSQVGLWQSLSSTILGGYRFQEGTWLAKNKLERYSQERSARNGTYLGRGGGGSSQQTRMASEFGPIRSRGRGMNQVKSSHDNDLGLQI